MYVHNIAARGIRNDPTNMRTLYALCAGTLLCQSIEQLVRPSCVYRCKP